MLRAVTFDHWDTLVHDPRGIRPRQLAAWLDVLEPHGYEVERAALEAAFDANWAVFEERWEANVQHGPRESVPLILDRLGLTCDEIVREELVEAFAYAGREAGLEVAEGAAETLGSLRDAGVRVGIVCDVGLTSSSTLLDRLERFGLLHFFDHWSFSDEVGCFKPYPAIFEHALAGLGVDDPGQVAHVGDGRRTDVAGALAMGMTAVRARWFADRGPDTGPEAHHVADDIRDVPRILGIGAGFTPAAGDTSFSRDDRGGSR
ncbi:MAG TPA: HAD family hydrolase [Actinomycetota bacterium]